MEANITIDRMARGYLPMTEELEQVLTMKNDAYLLQTADEVRRKAVGDTVHIRGILEFSNHCRCGCFYCGLRRQNEKLPRYRMEPDEIIEAAKAASEAGYRTVVLQSGEDMWYTGEKLCGVIEGIRRECGEMAITLSVGERPFEELRAFRAAGADRYLIKHECSDARMYGRICDGKALVNRIGCQRNLKKLGYELGGGFMVGLPGQRTRMVANDLLMLRRLGCDMAGIGPFIPHPDTPFGGYQPGSARLTLRAVALARLLLPKANLPATTSLGVLDKKGRDAVFSGGANVIMRKVTPWAYRRQYEIYPTDFGEETDLATARRELEEYIRSIGKVPL